jgi:hypothetical protein
MLHDVIHQFLIMIGYILLGICFMAIAGLVFIGLPMIYQEFKHRRYLRQCELYELEASLDSVHRPFEQNILDLEVEPLETPFTYSPENEAFFDIVKDVSAEQQKHGLSFDPYEEEPPPLMVFTYRNRTAEFFKCVDGNWYGSAN